MAVLGAAVQENGAQANSAATQTNNVFFIMNVSLCVICEMRCSKSDLGPRKNDFFVLAGDVANFGAAVSELRLFVIQTQSNVSVQIPIHAGAPGGRLAGG